MSYVKDTDIFDATNGGLEIITSYYPNAAAVINKSARQFKLRESEKTASASLKLLENGVWVVTDFGGDAIPRNGVQVCAIEEGKSYGEACAILGARFNIAGAELQIYKPVVEKRALKQDEEPDSASFIFKDFTEKELAILGPRVHADHCASFNLKSCKSYTRNKQNESVTINSTEDFPIMVFDFGTWQKIYQPNSFEKQWRFSYVGTKPKRHVFGLEAIEKQFNKNKEAQQKDDYDEEEDDNKSKKKDPRLDAAFIMSGGSDGLNLMSFNKFPIWFNSESEHLEWSDYKKLKIWVKEIYYVGDLDSTGVKQAIAMGLKFLDIKLLWLPEKLKEIRDKRGEPCKDFKNYVEKFYNPKAENAFVQGLDKLINNSLPFQFWTEYYKAPKMNYNLSNTRLYHFLAHMGFGRYEDPNLKEGFLYIRKEGSIIKVLHPYEIENYVHSFLEQKQYPPDLRDYIYKSNQLGERSLSKLPKVTIDFTNADRESQYLFFNKKVWKITGKEITEYNQGEVDRYVWEDKVIDFNVKKTEAHFNITKDPEGDFNIEIIKKDNPFLNYLINASRVHWKTELEDSFEGKKEIEADAYFKDNQFNINGSRLSDDERYEQTVHLVNKIYCIGYLLHTYKDDSKPWCLFVMDNKISETGESHGGSGKSVGFGNMNLILKRRFYIKGRDPKVTQNDFIYHGVTEDTDYVFVDDANQYLDFGFFYSEITGSMKVNPKNGQPYEIPFSKSPKFVITSNFTIKDDGPSTARRLLFCSFSDYYHENKDGEYKEARNIADDFGGRNLFRDFTDHEWNDFYNFCAQCIQFYLSHPGKINPPMDNVTKRSLRAEMGDAFEGWAEAFFLIRESSIDEEGPLKHLDNYFSKEVAFEDFLKTTKLGKWTPNKFKKALKAYCQLNEYVFNPKDLHGSGGRIVQKIDGKTQEVIYIRTIEKKQTAEQTGIQEFKSEEDIFKN
jgi:hypothetical protein